MTTYSIRYLWPDGTVARPPTAGHTLSQLLKIVDLVRAQGVRVVVKKHWVMR